MAGKTGKVKRLMTLTALATLTFTPFLDSLDACADVGIGVREQKQEQKQVKTLNDLVKANTEAIKEMTEIMYLMAKRVKKMESEVNRLKVELKRQRQESRESVKQFDREVSENGLMKKATRSATGKETVPKEEIGRDFALNQEKPFNGKKVLRICSIFKKRVYDKVKPRLEYLEKKTNAPFYAGIGKRYVVIFTTVPIPKNLLKRTGFGDAYWETPNKPIYLIVKKINDFNQIYDYLTK